MTDRHPNHRDLASLPKELRRTTVPPAARAWIERATGASVARTRRLDGASSTAIHGVTLSSGTRVVLRRYVWPGFLVDEPVAPRREVDGMRFAHAHGLTVPEVIASDPEGTDVGDGVPALLMSFVPGRAVATPDVRALAEVAATIHAVDADGLGHEYFPWYANQEPGPPQRSTRPALWERAAALRQAAPPEYEPRLVHRDFHPGNVLWARGRATGIVDWANACRGPWGCDVAHCRANLVVLGGAETADRFLAAYEALTGRTYDWFWEVASILEHDPDWWTPERLAEAEPRLAHALSEVGARP